MRSAATRYMPNANSSVRPTAVKSTPAPGTTFIPLNRSAKVPSPRARAAAIACSLVIPAGSCLPMTPLNNRSVAWPSTLGPITERAMPPMDSVRTAAIGPRCGRRRRARRSAEPVKSRDRPAAGSSSMARAAPRIGGVVMAVLPLPHRRTVSRRIRHRPGSHSATHHACRFRRPDRRRQR